MRSYSNISHVSGSDGRSNPQVVPETPPTRRSDDEATSQHRPWYQRRTTSQTPSPQSSKSELTKKSDSKSKRSRSSGHSKTSKKSSKTPIKRAKKK